MYDTKVLCESDMIPVKSDVSGIFLPEKGHDDLIREGDILANIVDPYEGHVIRQITAPCNGRIFFVQDKTLLLANALVYRIIKED